MNGLNSVLLSILLIMCIILVVFLVIICIKLLYTADRVNIILNDVEKKMKSILQKSTQTPSSLLKS